MRKSWIWAAALLCASGAASGAEFHAYAPSSGNLWVSYSGFRSVSVSDYRSPGPTLNYAGSGGQFTGNFTPVGGATNENFLRFFCIDLYQYAVVPGPASYQLSVWAQDDVRKLYDLAYPNRSALDFYDAGAKTNFGDFANLDDATAFQLALWELVGQAPDYSLASGNFTGSSSAAGVTAKAQTMLDGVKNYTGTNYERWTLYQLRSGTAQDYVSATFTVNPRQQVPEPGSLALFGLGLAGLSLWRRRRN